MKHLIFGRSLGGAVLGREAVKVLTGSVKKDQPGWGQSHQNS